MAGITPPRSPIRSKVRYASSSSSSVRASRKYEPPNGSAVFATPLSWARICWVLRAIRAAFSFGTWYASSYAFVWSDCVPPSTAASAWIVVRTMLISGCCAVRLTPAVWVWKRKSHDRGFFAPKVFRISRAQMRRAARYLANSSNRSLCALKKKDSRGANSSIFRPRSIPQRTYSMPFARVKASSCAAVAPRGPHPPDTDSRDQDLNVVGRGARAAAGPDPALALGFVGVVAVQRRHVEGAAEPRPAVRDQVFKPPVRVFGAPVAREHAHR